MTQPAQMREAWDKFAAGYDEAVTPFSMRVAEDALRRGDVRRGTRFLDVAAGGGALSIPAARLGAQVLSTDFSGAMVERLGARARAEGLSNLESCVMDGHNLELEDDAFDISGSQFGIMLFPDRPRALAELARVTRVRERPRGPQHASPHRNRHDVKASAFGNLSRPSSPSGGGASGSRGSGSRAGRRRRRR